MKQGKVTTNIDKVYFPTRWLSDRFYVQHLNPILWQRLIKLIDLCCLSPKLLWHRQKAIRWFSFLSDHKCSAVEVKQQHIFRHPALTASVLHNHFFGKKKEKQSSLSVLSTLEMVIKQTSSTNQFSRRGTMQPNEKSWFLKRGTIEALDTVVPAIVSVFIWQTTRVVLLKHVGLIHKDSSSWNYFLLILFFFPDERDFLIPFKWFFLIP